MPDPDKRPEGAYVTWSVYPDENDPSATTLFKIERVNGNQTVDSVELTPDETLLVIRLLSDGLRADRDRRLKIRASRPA